MFNHFPGKEDLFFDRDQEGRETLRDALRRRDPSVAPIEALRRLAHRLAGDGSPYLRFFAGSRRFVETIEGSEALKARARSIRAELAQVAAEAMAPSVGRDPADPDAHLAAAMLLATWSVAFIQAHRTFRRTEDPEQARLTFLDLVDKGAAGLEAAMAGSPYA